jgi:hypothetical protein
MLQNVDFLTGLGTGGKRGASQYKEYAFKMFFEF